MDLIDIVHQEYTMANIRAAGKEEALALLVEIARRLPPLSDISPDIILSGLHEREKKGSTGIGGHIAIPHTAVPGLDRFTVIIATSRKGIEFESIDRKKVRLFFMILAPEDRAADHLKVLANISRTLSLPGVKQELLAAESSTALFESFVRHLGGEGSGKKATEKLELLTVYLFDEELIYDILELFIQLGIEGANVADAYGMGEYISNVPLFAGFLGFMNVRTNRSKEIKAVVPESQVDSVIEGIEAITGDLSKTQGAAVLVTPILKMKGSMKMM